MATFTSWQGGGYGESGSSLGPSPVFRDAKDSRLAAYGVGPDTQYPDGYLGTQPASSRRQDKLLNGVHRTNTRSYSRGVHKGERINPGDYVWPKEFNPQSALEAQAKGMRFAPVGAEPVMLTNDGKVGPRGIYRPDQLERPDQDIIDLQRRSMLKQLAPAWR